MELTVMELLAQVHVHVHVHVHVRMNMRVRVRMDVCVYEGHGAAHYVHAYILLQRIHAHNT